jgi:LPXTG-motif cell wall-anchored protein
MKNKIFNSRKWHNWLGIIISIPIFIVGLTGIIFSFQDSFKNKPGEPQISTGWLPGYSSALVKTEMSNKNTEIKSSLFAPDGRIYYGTGNGIYFQKNGETGNIPELAGFEIRCIFQHTDILYIGSKNGLYSKNLLSGELKLLFKKDVHDINFRNDSTIAIADNKSLYVSSDLGKTWKKEEVTLNFEQVKSQSEIANYNQKIPLHKFIMDLHTGKAFFGKAYEAIWIVLVGLSCCLLSLTGFFMWFKRKKQMRKFRKKSSV